MTYALLTLATVAVLSGQSLLLLRLRRDVDAQWRGLNLLLEGGGRREPAGDEPQVWSDDALIRPGAQAPAALADPGAWVVAIIGDSADEVATLWGRDAGRSGILARYSCLAVASSDPSGVVVPVPFRRIAPEETRGLSMPVVAMIDPDGVIQGLGPVPGSGLESFVSEGEHQGFGPPGPEGHHH